MNYACNCLLWSKWDGHVSWDGKVMHTLHSRSVLQAWHCRASKIPSIPSSVGDGLLDASLATLVGGTSVTSTCKIQLAYQPPSCLAFTFELDLKYKIQPSPQMQIHTKCFLLFEDLWLMICCLPGVSLDDKAWAQHPFTLFCVSVRRFRGCACCFRLLFHPRLASYLLMTQWKRRKHGALVMSPLACR